MALFMEIYSKKRACWASRRGMLELDVILLPFIEQYYETLTDNEQRLITKLLNADDPDLFTWLMGYGAPSDPHLIEAVTLVRKHHYAHN